MKVNKHSISVDISNHLDSWKIINDNVMGGLSQGNVHAEVEKLIFFGNLSIENNGGFTGVYKKLPRLSEAINSVAIKIKGDGNRYQLRMKTQVMGYQLDYKLAFDTRADKREEYHFNLADFRASFRGRIIESAPVLKSDTISEVGFLMTSDQTKKFKLLVYTIEFYTDKLMGTDDE